MLLCGGAGGKTDPLALRAGDLSAAVNDALLSKLRNKLRKEHGFARASDRNGKALKRVPKMGVHALWFDQPAILPDAWTRPTEGEDAGLCRPGHRAAGPVLCRLRLGGHGDGGHGHGRRQRGAAPGAERAGVGLAYKATNTIPSSIRTG